MKKKYRLFVALAVMAIGAVLPAKAAVVESTAETENGLQFQLTYDTETDAKSFALYGVDFSKAVDESGKLVLGPVTGVTFANYDGEEHSLTTDIETYAILAGWDVNDYRESLKELRLEAVTELPSLFLSQPFLDSHKFPTALEKLFIGKLIPAIPDNAFPYHENLATVEFEEGSELKTIGINAFAGAAELKDKDTIWYSKLESIVLPYKVVTVGEWAFRGHPNMKEFTLDAYIKTIDKTAFYQCAIETLLLDKVDLSIAGKDSSPFRDVPIKHLVIYGISYTNSEAASGVSYFGYVPKYLLCSNHSEFDVAFRLPPGEEWDGVEFDEYCFANSGVTAIEMPEKMVPSKYEGEYNQNIIVNQHAFNSVTNLKSLDFSHATAGSIEIMDYAFAYSAIEELKLSNTVTHIGTSAFADSKLKNLVLEQAVDPEGHPVVTQINSYAFEYTYSLNTVEIKGTIVDENGVKNKLARGAFYNSGIQHVLLPDNLEHIGDVAFYSSKLKSIKLGPNIKDLGSFGGMTNPPLDGVFEMCYDLEEADLSATQLEELPAYAFCQCHKLTTLKLPVTPMKRWGYCALNSAGIKELVVNVEQLGGSAFQACANLETVKFVHPSMKTIPAKTLWNLPKLKNVDFGNHVKWVNKDAIFNCATFDSLVVSRNIEYIEPGAVNYNDNGGSLKSITFKSTAFTEIPNPDYAPFKGLDVNLYIDEAVTDISAYLFSGMKIANSVEINDLMVFDENAFKDTEFAHIDWHYPTIAASPFKNSTIRLLTFSDCPVLPDELFGSNHTIQNIDLSSVREIGKRAFFDVGLQNEATFGVLTVPASVQKIDARAFYNNKFDAIHIEKGTTLSIGNLAFGVGTDSYYSHIICDYPSDNIPTITASAFKTVHSERDVDVLSVGNCADVEAYQAATGWKSIRAKKWDGVSEYTVDFELVGTVFDHLKSDLLEEVTIDGQPASLATVGCNNHPWIQFIPKCSDIVFDHWPDGSTYADYYYPVLTSDTVIRIYVTELTTEVKLQLSDPSLASAVKLKAKRHEDSEFTEMSEFKINNCGSGSYDIMVELLDPDHYVFKHWIDPTPAIITDREIQGVKGGTYTAVVERKEFHVWVVPSDEADKDKIADLLINGVSKGNASVYEIYPYGTEVTVEFKGNNTESLRYIVDRWDWWSSYEYTQELVSDANKVTFILEGPIDLTPVLREAEQFTVTARPSEWTLGTAEVTPVEDAAVQGKAAKFWEGSTVQLEAKSLGEHFHFERWNDGNTEPTRTMRVTEDHDFIAFFVRDSIDLALSVEGIDPELVTLSGAHRYGWGNDVVFSAEYTGEDYTFLGWYKDDELFSNETSCSILAETDLSLVARYEINTYTVRFFDNDGKQIGADQVINWNEAAVEPNDEDIPTVEGHTFTGWDKDFDHVKSDLDIKALYEINTYIVYFYDMVGNQLGETQIIEYGKAAVAPEAPAVEGYHFTGWDKDFDAVKSDLIVNATYEKNVYTVTFVDKGGNVLKEEKVKWDEAATAPSAPSWEGHTFTGWDTDFNHVKSDLTVKPIYDTKLYTVRFIDWNGKELKAEKVEYGAGATAPKDPEREGYTFAGWDKAFDLITEDLTVKATYTVNVYTVTFVDKESKTIGEAQKVEYGKAAEAPEAPAVEGYHFTGWDKDFSYITSDLVVYAIYEEDDYTPQNLSVTLLPKGDDLQIIFSWDKVDGAASYEVMLAEGGKELGTRNTVGQNIVPLFLSAIVKEYHITPGTYTLDWSVRSTDDLGAPISEWAAGKAFEVTIKDTGTGMESIQHSAVSIQKVLRDGALFIIVGDRMYDAAGRLVK